jgi:hypothetical protein
MREEDFRRLQERRRAVQVEREAVDDAQTAYPCAYIDDDLAAIANAASVSAELVRELAPRFEQAVWWYRIDSGNLKRTAPSVLVRRLDRIRTCAQLLLRDLRPGKAQRGRRRIAASAWRLLAALGVNAIDEADDGPDPQILQALAPAMPGVDRDAIIDACVRVGRICQCAETAEGGETAVQTLLRCAKSEARVVKRVGNILSPRGTPGRRAVNGWIARLLPIYKRITGRRPGTSVGAPERTSKGKASGPLIRFLAAAGKPIGLVFATNAWRMRVRHVMRRGRRRRRDVGITAGGRRSHPTRLHDHRGMGPNTQLD